MTSSEFRIWLKGFTDALGGDITPAQLEILKNKINEVNFQPYNPNIIFPNSPSYPWNPQNPFYVGDFPITICSGGTNSQIIYKTTTNQVK